MRTAAEESGPLRLIVMSQSCNVFTVNFVFQAATVVKFVKKRLLLDIEAAKSSQEFKLVDKVCVYVG
jgi:hypothetical protein